MRDPTPPKLFDRALAAKRLDRAWALGVPGADFLLRRAADDLTERLSLVKRQFEFAAELGTPGPHAAQALSGREGAKLTLRIAPSAASAGAFHPSVVGDVARSPLAENAFDLVVSLFALHQVDDLPGALLQARRALRPDGLFLACLPGGETLTELRTCLLEAEADLLGGASPRIAPMTDVRALGGLLQRAGFALPVVDVDRIVLRHRDLFALMKDLRTMGATSSLVARSRVPASRALFAHAAAIAAERYSDPDGRLRTTIDCLWVSGWAPHESQPKPLKPGSAAMRLEEALKSVTGGTSAHGAKS